MTKSTITREQLLEIIETDHVQCGEASYLARMALAAMDSDPVGWTDEQVLRDVEKDGCGYLFKAKPITQHADPRRVILLYRHAQQPVVSETDRQAIADKVYGKCCRIPGATFYNAAEFAIDEVEACRAAMLAAAPQSPGSEPATVPGKWIPVSERMPEVGVKVLCFPAEDEPIHAVFNGQLWLQDVSWSGSEEPIDNVIPVTVTHWMPLPSAPQEVKGE